MYRVCPIVGLLRIGRSWRLQVIRRPAFLLAAGHDAAPAQQTIFRRDDGVPLFAIAIVAVQHHPVVCLTGVVRPHRVGEQRRVPVDPATRMQNREPRLARGIESPRCDPPKLSGRGSLAIFAIHIQKLGNAPCSANARRQTDAPQSMCEGVSDASQPLRAKPRQGFEPPIVCRSLEVGEGFESEFVM